MPDIRLRQTAKGIVRAAKKTAVAGRRMRDAYVRTKEASQGSAASGETSPEEYAADRVSGGAQAAAREGTYRFDRQGRKALRTTKENFSKLKGGLERRKAGQLKRQVQTQAAAPVSHPGPPPQAMGRGGAKSIKAAGQRTRTIKETARSSGKATIKTARKSIKTARQTTKETVKATEAVEKAAKKTAQAAKASRQAVKAARAAEKNAERGARAAVKAAATTVRAAIAAVKTLAAAVMAGGWAAAAVILLLCMVGLLCSSGFGIFFSGEDSGTGQTMQTAVREINGEYQDRIDTIKTSLAHDTLEMSGSRAVWKEVLSVYAVKTATGPDNPQEVVTVDDGKKAILKDIFWRMNEISSRTETRIETEITETDDGHGNIVETSAEVTRTTLYITVDHKTVQEMAADLGFSPEQGRQLSGLLADENNSLWSAVLSGSGKGDGEIVAVALSQTGNVGGQPYWSWYGFGGRVEWCACFVSWCANECGYIDAGVIPKYAGCVNGVRWFRERGLWQDNRYEPRPGDIIFFDWADGGQDGVPDHTGIVEKVEGGTIYTVEGNSGDTCRENHYPAGCFEIFGFGTPAY